MAKMCVRQLLAASTGLALLALIAFSGVQAGEKTRVVKAAVPPPEKAVESSKSFLSLEKTGDADKVRLINKALAEKWRANKLTPSPRCNDFDFLRRASLDIIGRIATHKEIEQYLRDPESTRRARLIDRLLKSDEYARNWANMWTVWLLTRVGANDQALGVYHEQMRNWLEKQFVKENMSFKDLVSDLLTATGKTNENGAVNYFLAHLGEPIPRGEQEKEGKATMVPITARTTRVFLGLQLQCA
ncbi:MAG TPA: DUF1549 domain-containing protein [Gemmataceae bacterium]|nr:DUF1549 domain-containing protein [Gemmataceae bacterium]